MTENAPHVEFHRFKQSRRAKRLGLWYCSAADNGPALKDALHRVNGVYLSTRWGLVGVTVRRAASAGDGS